VGTRIFIVLALALAGPAGEAATYDWVGSSCRLAYRHFHGNPEAHEEALLARLNETQTAAVKRLRVSVALYHQMFEDRVENRDNAPSKKDRHQLAEQLIADIERAFPTLGIEYEVRPSAERGREVVIKPSAKHPLGRLAGGIKRAVDYDLVFNPEFLLKDLSEGMEDPDNKRLFMSIDAILQIDRGSSSMLSLARPTFVELHELIHVGESIRKSKGRTSEVSGALTPQGDKIEGASIYSDGFWFDESPAHGVEEFARFRELRQLRPVLENPEAFAAPQNLELLRTLIGSLAQGSTLGEKNRVLEKITLSMHDHSEGALSTLHGALDQAKLSKKGKKVTLTGPGAPGGWEFRLDTEGPQPLVEVSGWSTEDVAIDLQSGDPQTLRAVRLMLQKDLPEKRRLELGRSILQDQLKQRLGSLSMRLGAQGAAYADLSEMLQTVPPQLGRVLAMEPGKHRNRKVEKIRQRLLQSADQLEILAGTISRRDPLLRLSADLE
jgi:hypothetical protein